MHGSKGVLQVDGDEKVVALVLGGEDASALEGPAALAMIESRGRRVTVRDEF